MSEVTGAPIDALPPRVLRLRPAQVLSKWLGESDRNLDRFFDEAEGLAAEPFVRDGRSFRLPVLAILEEIDGLARSRGEDAVYDRILTTALQRLDPTRPELRDKLILFLATTNVPHQVDAAFLRRIGGQVERFGGSTAARSSRCWRSTSTGGRWSATATTRPASPAAWPPRSATGSSPPTPRNPGSPRSTWWDRAPAHRPSPGLPHREHRRPRGAAGVAGDAAR